MYVLTLLRVPQRQTSGTLLLPVLALRSLPFTWAQILALRGKRVEEGHRGERWDSLVVFSIVSKLGHGHSSSLAGLVNSTRLLLGKLSLLLGASDNLLTEMQSYKPLTNSQNMILLIFSISFKLIWAFGHISLNSAFIYSSCETGECFSNMLIAEEVSKSFLFPPFPLFFFLLNFSMQ